MRSYFSHDSNARNSEKLIKVRMSLGAEGYGVYFMILERMREEEDYMSIKDYNVIAFDLRVDASVVKKVVENFGLFVFTEDGKYFYSESFLKRMELKDEKSRKKSEAGKKGAAKRWEEKEDKDSNNSSAIAKPKKNNSSAIAKPKKNIASKVKESKVKESKVKESKVNKSKEKAVVVNKKETVLTIIEDYSATNLELKEALLGFKEMREKKKAPLTIRAIKMALTSLGKLSKNINEQIEIIDQSTMNSWNGFYNLKNKNNNNINNSTNALFDMYDEWADEGVRNG